MKPLTFFVLLVLGVGAAHADVPNPGASSMPPGLTLVGYAGTTADPLGSATFVIRHLGGAPMSGSVVVIDFSACTDARLSADALEPGFLLDCANHAIRGFTDRNGMITFHIVGSGNGGPPRALPACAAVYADGVAFGSLAVSDYDLDGMNGVTVSDLSIAYRDGLSGQYRARSDFDFNGEVNALDLGRLYRVMLASGSVTSGAGTCGP